jgi:ubiquinone/menaquinone biosynthesis C-methylase UbiE
LSRGSREFEGLWAFSTGFYGVWIAFTGKRMGLLSALARAPATPEELAISCGQHLPAVRAWCSAAGAYRIICRKAGGKFWLPPKMKSYLVDKAHPDYLGGQFAYLALRSLEYRGFDGLFKSGKTRPVSNSLEAIDEATNWDHYAFIRTVKRDKKLHPMMSRGCKFADIGCGTGSLLLKLLPLYPRSQYFGLDPSVKAVSRAKKDLGGKPATILTMSAERMNFSEKFDIVYLGESLYAARDKSRVIANCFRALRRGGHITIVEGLLPGTRREQGDLIIMGMQLDFALQGHSFMTRKEIWSLLKTSGFRDLSYTALGGSVYLIRAEK